MPPGYMMAESLDIVAHVSMLGTGALPFSHSPCLLRGRAPRSNSVPRLDHKTQPLRPNTAPPLPLCAAPPHAEPWCQSPPTGRFDAWQKEMKPTLSALKRPREMQARFPPKSAPSPPAQLMRAGSCVL